MTARLGSHVHGYRPASLRLYGKARLGPRTAASVVAGRRRAYDPRHEHTVFEPDEQQLFDEERVALAVGVEWLDGGRRERPTEIRRGHRGDVLDAQPTDGDGG